MVKLAFILSLLNIYFFAEAQNIGIGTTTPQTLLHVNSTTSGTIIRAETNFASAEAGLELKTAGAGPFDFLEFRKWIAGSSGSIAGGINLDGLSTITTGSNSTAGLLIGTKPFQPVYFTTGNIERMRIRPDGRIVMGDPAITTFGKLNIFAQGNDHSIYSFNSTTTGSVTNIQSAISAPDGAALLATSYTASLTSPLEAGRFAIAAQSGSGGYSIGAFTIGGTAIRAKLTSGTGYALSTSGPLRLNEISEGAGKVLTSDAVGNATWQSITGNHDHFGASWSGNAATPGLSVYNNSASDIAVGIFGISNGPFGIGVQGSSNDPLGFGVVGILSHGNPYPPLEGNSAMVGINNSGNGIYAASMSGYAIKAVKDNFASATGSVAFFRNGKTTNTAPVILIQNAATNPVALELNNGYLKVSGANKTAYVHTTSAANISGHISYLNYPNAAVSDMVFVTHTYSPANTYFNYNYGVYWNGLQWSIYIEKNGVFDPSTPMPVNINFNVLVIKQ